MEPCARGWAFTRHPDGELAGTPKIVLELLPYNRRVQTGSSIRAIPRFCEE
jgi:hypothetical protein